MIIDIVGKCAVSVYGLKNPYSKKLEAVSLNFYSEESLLSEIKSLKKYLFECEIADNDKLHIYKLIRLINEELQNRINRRASKWN